ncbi:PTS system galactose-specific transporter subunit IIB [Streptococcus pneumoniae]|nr:PTS system galactose-specific transporter subunit IIB [Streptococcus pneumoniae]
MRRKYKSIALKKELANDSGKKKFHAMKAQAVIEAGPILFRIPAMSAPVFDNIRLPAKQNMV